jgi:NAD dependent epimerase/dehydratase family enzyme
MGERVVIAGASGFIGQFLARAFILDGATVRFIGRHGADASWGDTAAITSAIEGADLLINLAGKSVNCRYTAANRAEILRSRVDTTRELAAAVLACERPPALWVNSSTATIYRHAEDRPMTEADGELGEGFSVDVARAWEREFFEAELPKTRRVALRMAIVLGDGSALLPLIRLVRFGLGGAQLDGRWFSTPARRASGTFHRFGARRGGQKFSWIHIADVLGIIRFISSRPDISGIVNASAPNPSDNRTLMASLRRVLGMPFGLPAPRWMLEVGTFLIRTETELVLKSRWVLPERLRGTGYEFAYPELEPALRQIVQERANTAAPRVGPGLPDTVS